jgi:hypothetical protein
MRYSDLNAEIAQRDARIAALEAQLDLPRRLELANDRIAALQKRCDELEIERDYLKIARDEALERTAEATQTAERLVEVIDALRSALERPTSRRSGSIVVALAERPE